MIIALPIMAFIFGKFWISEKCSIIHCGPATWNKIQEIIIKNSNSWGTEYSLDRVNVFPTIDGTGTIAKIRYVVHYVSTKPARTADQTHYPIRQIIFDNQSLWIDSHLFKNFSTSPPASENVVKLTRVIRPEDAINLTYDLANTALRQPVLEAMLELNFSEEPDIESTWEVIYFGSNKEQVHYWLNAQNGKVVDNQ